MKKCKTCGYNNTDIMNYCLECGSALAYEPKMVVPLDSLSGQEEADHTEQVTEVYENETVVSNRHPIEQSVPTFQQEQQASPKNSNTKLYLAIGGGLFAIVMLIGLAAAGFFIYALQNQKQEPPSRPIVVKTPIKADKDDIPTPTPTPKKVVVDLPDIEKPTPPTPDISQDTITFPTPTSPTKKGKFTVNAKTGWQLSEVKTVGSQNFTVQSNGRIKLDGIKKKVGAKGIDGYEDRRIIKEFKTGALLMRTHYPDGRYSQIQPVAASKYWINEPDETGRIEFLINDNSPESNSGSFKVTVKDLGIEKK